MDFIKMNASWSSQELLNAMEENCHVALLSRREIQRLKENGSHQEDLQEDMIEFPMIPAISSDEMLNQEFEEEVGYYIELYKSLDEDFKEEDLKELLPSKKHYEYIEIIRRLQLESVKEIKEIDGILLEDGIAEAELIEYKKLIAFEKRKISALSKTLEKREIIEEKEDVKNNLILVPTRYGNIRVIDELEHIPIEFYDRFLELFQSIIDGTFKNIKSLTIDRINICEVKDFQIRIIFKRIGKNTYAIISAFLKKFTTDKLYKESINSKAYEYKKIEPWLKERLEDPEFQAENEFYVEELFNLLSSNKGKTKKKVMDNE